MEGPCKWEVGRGEGGNSGREAERGRSDRETTCAPNHTDQLLNQLSKLGRSLTVQYDLVHFVDRYIVDTGPYLLESNWWRLC